MNLCIDIDGTLTDPYYWLKRANDYFGTSVKPEEVTYYSVEEALNLTPGTYNLFYHLYGRLIHKEAEIRFGVQDILNRLAQQGHQIHYVTAREEGMRKVTEEWLEEYELPMDSLTLLGTPNKIWKAKQLKSDFFIEDSYDNVIQLSKAGFKVLLIDCTYNQGDLPHNVVRVKNWNEIYKQIEWQQSAAGVAVKQMKWA